MGLVFLGFVFFYLFPSIALLSFVLVSIYHFGEQHWEVKASNANFINVKRIYPIILHGLIFFVIVFMNNINIVNNLTIELGKLGVEIDDPALGIVNFPSLRGIETVFLSYRLGEKSVRHWHEFDENYESRRILEQELDIIKQ